MFSPNEFTPVFECKSCSIICSKQSDWNRHISTTKHKKSANILSDNKTTQTNCDVCVKVFSSRYELKKHLNTKSHINRANNIVKTHICEKCSQEYSSYTGLWQHKRKCNVQPQVPLPIPAPVSPPVPISDILAEILKSNNELQKQMLELCKGGINTTVIQTTNNTQNNNNKFNINAVSYTHLTLPTILRV